MGRRTNPRLAQSKPPSGKGFRGVDRERQSVGLHCLGAAAHQEISLTITQCFFDTIELFRLRFRHLVRKDEARAEQLLLEANECDANSIRAQNRPLISPEV